MKKQENLNDKRGFLRELPPLGYRIVKTTIAVFLCLLGYHLVGYRGDDMPTEAAITAIICMQPYVRDTREYAVNRLMGTVVGAVWAVVFILLTSLIPAAERHLFGMYALSFGILRNPFLQFFGRNSLIILITHIPVSKIAAAIGRHLQLPKPVILIISTVSATIFSIFIVWLFTKYLPIMAGKINWESNHDRQKTAE